YRIQWSGLNATTTWTSGVNQSDFQDFPDGGIVRGVAGGEYGVIFQDAAVRRMIYAPGSPVIFQMERLSEEKGIFAPLSIVHSAGGRVFYIGTDGFQVILPGGVPQAIGKERIDRTFFADVDTANLQLCIGASDPKAPRVYWAYKSISGSGAQGGSGSVQGGFASPAGIDPSDNPPAGQTQSSGLFDKIIGYDYALDRFFPVVMSGEYLSTLAKPGITLEALDAISASIDALAFSLDGLSTAALSDLSAVNSAHALGFFTGAALEATLDTPEQAISAAAGARASPRATPRAPAERLP